MTFISLSLFILLFSACSTSKKAVTQDKMIIGDWVVESVNVGGEIVPATLLGGEVKFAFHPDGTAAYSTPDGRTEYGRYSIIQGKIIDPDSPSEVPVDIVSLSREKLVISMIEQGERMEMTLASSSR